MTFRRTAGELFCVIALFGLSRTASAQDAPKVEVFGGFSYANASLVSGRANVNGWQASAAFNLNRWFGAAADFSGLYGGSVKTTVPVSTCPAPPCQPGMISLDGYVHTFLGGPRSHTGSRGQQLLAMFCLGAHACREQPYSPTLCFHRVFQTGFLHLLPVLGWR